MITTVTRYRTGEGCLYEKYEDAAAQENRELARAAVIDKFLKGIEEHFPPNLTTKQKTALCETLADVVLVEIEMYEPEGE